MMNSHLKFTAVQIGQTFAVNAFGSELGYVLVHVHAHQPVTHLLIGPFRKGAVLPQVLPCDRSRLIIKGLKTNTYDNINLYIFKINIIIFRIFKQGFSSNNI